MPQCIKNLDGQRFGKLLVVCYLYSDHGHIYRCKCDCGKTTEALGYRLINGHKKSCGCLITEAARKARSCRKIIHGKTGTKCHAIWTSMLDRCFNKNHKQFHRYGGRGITVCDRWKTFTNFYEDMGDAPKGLSLDRIDNDKGYSPKNCRWATRKQQARNKADTIYIEWTDGFRPLKELCEELGIKYQTAYARYRDGYSIEGILSQEKGCFFRDNNPLVKMITYKGKTQSITKWAEEVGLKMCTLANRLRKGWSLEMALETPLMFQKSQEGSNG